MTGLLQVFAAGDGRYVVDVRLWGKGRRSGAEVNQRFAFLFIHRPEDDKVTCARLLADVPAALSAAESAAPQTA